MERSAAVLVMPIWAMSSLTVQKQHGGLRYCINLSSSRFIPKREMEAEGYG